MSMQDSQEEVGAILAHIAMIAEEVNVLAPAGSGASTAQAEQLACVVEVKLRVGVMSGLGTSVCGRI
ncbi:hypothetical protein MCEREM21A_02260 [Sphingomonadaceae bacterium]